MTPYEEGVEAFRSGRHIVDNPYNCNTVDYSQWGDGWIDEWIRDITPPV